MPAKVNNVLFRVLNGKDVTPASNAGGAVTRIRFESLNAPCACIVRQLKPYKLIKNKNPNPNAPKIKMFF